MTASRILVLGAVIAVVVAAVAYSLFRTPEEASGPIEAEPIAVPSALDEPASDAAASGDDTAPAGADGVTVFEIVAAESEARFLIDEVLRGADKTVVGTTDQVSARIAVDLSRPADAQVGAILVNARTFVTDNDYRNRAVKNRILFTDDHEFIRFEPLAITGLPEGGVVAGDVLDLQMSGNLTVTGATLPVTFDLSVRVADETRLEGTARAQIRHADFGLSIPDSRQVDTVADDVILELEFVARATS